MKKKIIKRIWDLEKRLRAANSDDLEMSIKNELDFLRDLILSE